MLISQTCQVNQKTQKVQLANYVKYSKVVIQEMIIKSPVVAFSQSFGSRPSWTYSHEKIKSRSRSCWAPMESSFCQVATRQLMVKPRSLGNKSSHQPYNATQGEDESYSPICASAKPTTYQVNSIPCSHIRYKDKLGDRPNGKCREW